MSEPRPRVLMLLENNAYPNDTRVRYEARALASAGYRVMVISPMATGHGKYAVIDGVSAYRYRAAASSGGMLGFVREYAKALVATFLLTLKVAIRPGFDIIHAHNPPDMFVVIGAFYRLFGKRFVFDHHDLAPEMYRARFPEGPGIVHRLLVLFERLTFRLSDLVISTNESYRRVAVERGGVPPERVAVVRNGPDLRRVNLVEPDPELRGRAEFILAYVGVMGVQDGIDYLLRALQHLRDELGRDNFFCVLMGKGDARLGLQDLAGSLGLDDHVWFAGHLPLNDLLPYLSAADICLDPDPSDGYNDHSTMIKMMEYMALSKPIVAFDLPEHRVTAGEAALYAIPNDELDYSRKIARLMDDPDLRARMGRVGRTRVEERLAWSHQELRLLEAYERLGRSVRGRAVGGRRE